MRWASAFCRNLQLCWHEAHCQGQTRLPGVLLPSPGSLFPPVPATLGWAAHGCLPLFVFLRGLIDCRCSPHTFTDQSQKILSRERMNCQSLVKWTLQVQSHPPALLLIFMWNVYRTSYTNKIKHCLKDHVRTRKNEVTTGNKISFFHMNCKALLHCAVTTGCYLLTLQHWTGSEDTYFTRLEVLTWKSVKRSNTWGVLLSLLHHGCNFSLATSFWKFGLVKQRREVLGWREAHTDLPVHRLVPHSTAIPRLSRNETGLELAAELHPAKEELQAEGHALQDEMSCPCRVLASSIIVLGALAGFVIRSAGYTHAWGRHKYSPRNIKGEMEGWMGTQARNLSGGWVLVCTVHIHRSNATDFTADLKTEKLHGSLGIPSMYHQKPCGVNPEEMN